MVAVEIVKKDALFRRFPNTSAARHDHNAPRVIGHDVDQSIDQCEVANVIHEKLNFDTLAYIGSLQSHNASVGHYGIEGSTKLMYRVPRGDYGVEVREITCDRCS